jgi:protocatechuate 3,4-dioxygenase, beta subunit
MTSLTRRDLLLAGTAAALAACSGRSSDANAATRPVRTDLYACEGCEPTFQHAPHTLTSDVDIARGERGEPLVLDGVVRQADGKTPAPGVIIYLHQTNAEGLYANGGSEDVWSRRHGRLRGWAVSDAEGRYRFRTIKPAPYPDMTMPAHIHLMIGEPGRRPYYIDDVVFDGEFKVDAAYRANQELRGGSGIVKLSRDGEGRLRAVRDIVLERHP